MGADQLSNVSITFEGISMAPDVLQAGLLPACSPCGVLPLLTAIDHLRHVRLL